jgi:hypothetical protein
MGLILKKDLDKWIKKQTDKGSWLPINDAATPQGRQITYMTYAGEFVIIQYDIKGNITMIGKPMAMPQTMPQGWGFPGGGFPSIAGKG